MQKSETVVKSNARMAAVLPCSCLHEFQDSLYGRKMRVMVPSQKSGAKDVTCTVCGARHKVN